MKDTEFDVAIVGASIAGCTAATLLGRQGATVALLESHSAPDHYKVMCTHVFQGSAYPTLRRLGIADQFERAGARRSEPRIWSRYGWITPPDGYMDRIDEVGHGLNIRRQTADPMLREMTAGTDGVELMMGQTATGVLQDRGRARGVRVRSKDGEERELTARLVVGADGRGSGVAKLAGRPTKSQPNNRFAYMAYFKDTPLVTGDCPQMWFLDPDMAYAFPTDDNQTMLACVAHKDRMPEFKADAGAAMATMYERVPDGPAVDPEKRVSKFLGKLDVPNERRRPDGPGLALVGDAALSADPLWGVGCGWAFQSGEWLAEEAGPALSGGGEDELDRALSRYARRHRKGLAMHNRMLSTYSSGRRFNPAEKILFRGAARNEELAARFSLVGERWIPPQRIMTPSTLALALKANLSRGAKPIGLPTSATAEARPA